MTQHRHNPFSTRNQHFIYYSRSIKKGPVATYWRESVIYIYILIDKQKPRYFEIILNTFLVKIVFFVGKHIKIISAIIPGIKKIDGEEPPIEQLNSVKQQNRLSTISSDSPISTSHYDSIVDELRCLGCSKPLLAPIKLCETGHCICTGCTSQSSKCPLCSNEYTQIRCIPLETIIAKAQFNCSNVVRGCLVRLPAVALKQHERRCGYQLGECFMGKVWGKCDWSGCEIDWIQHCTAQHSDRILFESSATLSWQFVLVKQRPPKPICAYYIFQVLGQTFNLYQILDKIKKKLFWTVICASRDRSISKKYAYEIEVFSKKDPFRMQMQRAACHAEADEDILEDGRCIAFDLIDMKRYMDLWRVSNSFIGSPLNRKYTHTKKIINIYIDAN